MKKMFVLICCLFSGMTYADTFLAKEKDHTYSEYFMRVANERYPDRKFTWRSLQNPKIQDVEAFNKKLSSSYVYIEDFGHLVNIVNPYLFACITERVIIVSDLGTPCFSGNNQE